LNGKTKKWDEHALSVTHNLVDTDRFTVATPQGPIAYPQWLEAIKVEYENGTRVTSFEVKEHPAGVEYSLVFQNPDVEGKMRVRSIGVVENYKFIRVEPLENAQNYNKFLGDPN
jgi:hypothetical protein